MGVRETLNKQPALATGATIAIIVLALGFIAYQFMSSARPRIPTRSYYTVDDGATYFSDDMNLIPPFDHDGKPAVKADVFSCGGTRFVGFLERYNQKAQKAIEDDRAKNDLAGIGEAMSNGLELKAPMTGDKGWTNSALPAAIKISNLTCPDGSKDMPEAVLP